MALRKNRSVVEATRAMLEEKSLAMFYWAEAVRTAIYIQNQIRDKVSAHELYFGTKPNLRHLRVFSSIAYAHVPKEKRMKLDAKAEKCIFVRYSDEQKGYKCYNPRTSTCSGTATGAMSMEQTTQHPNRHTGTSRRGNNRRAGFYTASRHVWASSYSATFRMLRRRRVRGRT